MIHLTLALTALAALGPPDDFKRERGTELLAMEGKAAPALTVSDWRGGEAMNLASLKGKVVVLDFWGTW